MIAERIQFMPRAREGAREEGMERTPPGPGMEHTSPRPSHVGEELDVPPLEEDDIPF